MRAFLLCFALIMIFAVVTEGVKRHCHGQCPGRCSKTAKCHHGYERLTSHCGCQSVTGTHYCCVRGKGYGHYPHYPHYPHGHY